MMIKQIARIIEILNLVGAKSFGKKLIKILFKNEEFFFLDQIYESLKEKVCARLVVNLPGRGCAWYKISEGCTMCGFNKKLDEVNQNWKFSAADLLGLFKIADSLSQSEKPEVVYIYNGGSFLNENEIPLKTQLAIASQVRRHSTLRVLFVESRPEFITNERVFRLVNVLGEKKLEIGIGLEAVTNKVREEYIHKGFGLLEYERAVEMLKRHKVYILTYVFLKPMGLSEKEAIEEAVRTIQYAFEVGSDEISLSCAFIQKGTKMSEAYERGEFRPPWLWSIIEVVTRTAHLGPIRIGSFTDEPPPIDFPRNCHRCSQKVEKAIQNYNLNRQISVFHKIDCECREQWLRET